MFLSDQDVCGGHVGVKSLIDLPLSANESSKIEAQG